MLIRTRQSRAIIISVTHSHTWVRCVWGVCVCQINNRKLNIIMQHVTNNNKNKNNRNRTFKLAVMFARSFWCMSVCEGVRVRVPPGIFAQLCTKLITFEFPRTISPTVVRVDRREGKMLPIVFPLVDTLIQWNCTITTTTTTAIKPGIYPLFFTTTSPALLVGATTITTSTTTTTGTPVEHYN